MAAKPEEQQWAMFAHLAGLVMFIGIPFGNILGPVVVWMIKKDQFPYVDQEGKESINFGISMTLYYIVGAAGLFCFGIGLVVLPILGLAELVLRIIGSIQANTGSGYSYPLTLRLIK